MSLACHSKNKESHFLPKRLIFLSGDTEPVFDIGEKEALQKGTGELLNVADARLFLRRNIDETKEKTKKKITETYNRISAHPNSKEIEAIRKYGGVEGIRHQSLQNLDLALTEIESEFTKKLSDTHAEMGDQELNFIRETAAKLEGLLGDQEMHEIAPVPHLEKLFQTIDKVKIDWAEGWGLENEFSKVETYLKKKLIEMFSTPEKQEILKDNQDNYGARIERFLEDNSGNWWFGAVDHNKVDQILLEISTDVAQKLDHKKLEKFKKNIQEGHNYLNQFTFLLPQVVEQAEVKDFLALDPESVTPEQEADVLNVINNLKIAILDEINAQILEIHKKFDSKKDKIQNENLKTRLEALQILNANILEQNDDTLFKTAHEINDLPGDLDQHLKDLEKYATNQEHLKFNQELAALLTELKDNTKTGDQVLAAISAKIDTLSKHPDFEGKEDLISILESVKDILEKTKADDRDRKIEDLTAENEALKTKIEELEEKLARQPKGGEPKEKESKEAEEGPKETKEKRPSRDTIQENWKDKTEIEGGISTLKTKSGQSLKLNGFYRLATQESNFAIRNDEGYPAIGVLPKDGIAQIIDEKAYNVKKTEDKSYNYLKIKYEGKEGWVANGYFEEVKKTEEEHSHAGHEHGEEAKESLTEKYRQNITRRINKNPGLNQEQKTAQLKNLESLINKLKICGTVKEINDANITFDEHDRRLTALNRVLAEVQKFEQELTNLEFEILQREEIYEELERHLGNVKKIEEKDHAIYLDLDWKGVGAIPNAQIYIRHIGEPPYRQFAFDVYSNYLHQQEPKKEVKYTGIVESIGDLLASLIKLKFAHDQGQETGNVGEIDYRPPTEVRNAEEDPKNRFRGLDLYRLHEADALKRMAKFRDEKPTDKSATKVLRVFGQLGERMAATPQHHAFEMHLASDGSITLIDTMHDTLREYKVASQKLEAAATDQEVYQALKKFGDEIYQNDKKKGVESILLDFGFHQGKEFLGLKMEKSREAFWLNIKDQPYQRLKNFVELMDKPHIDENGKKSDENRWRLKAQISSGLEMLNKNPKKYQEMLEKEKKKEKDLPLPDFSTEIRLYQEMGKRIEQIRKLHNIPYQGQTIHHVLINVMRYQHKL